MANLPYCMVRQMSNMPGMLHQPAVPFDQLGLWVETVLVLLF